MEDTVWRLLTVPFVAVMLFIDPGWGYEISAIEIIAMAGLVPLLTMPVRMAQSKPVKILVNAIVIVGAIAIAIHAFQHVDSTLSRTFLPQHKIILAIPYIELMGLSFILGYLYKLNRETHTARESNLTRRCS